MDTDCICSFSLGAQLNSLTLGLCPLKVSGNFILELPNDAVPHVPNRRSYNTISVREVFRK